MLLYRLRRLRHLIRLHVVNHIEQVTKIMQILSVLISLTTVGAIICYHGFFIDLPTKEVIHWIIVGSLTFYVFKYYFFLVYSLHHWRYIKESWFECIIILILILYFFIVHILGIELRIFQHENAKDYYLLFIQCYFLVIAFIELGKASTFLARFNLSPPIVMMFSFLLLISIGTFLLMLPRMTTNGISFIDALFTSTSASCVTGLSVISTCSDFTFNGQIVIMLLIQLGGISILSFASFFSLFLSKSHVSLRQQHLIMDLLSANRISDSYILLREIIISTICIEAIGALLMFIYWKTTGAFSSNSENVFYSIFHSISAFNNAGFSLWDRSFMDKAVLHSYYIQTVVMILVFLGGIGFVVLSDFFNPKIIRNRKKYPWKSLHSGTKIVLFTTFGIIIVCTILFCALEFNHTLCQKQNFFERVFDSLFQVISGRTAGFNIVNIGMLGNPTILILIIVMFIGAAPGSTGGGIKVTTFYVIMKSAFATIRGKKYIEFQKKMIPFELVDKSYSIMLMSLILILASTFALTIVEPNCNFAHLLFETVSAFSTCGLSTEICASFSWEGKAILVTNMYIGRIGTLTLAFALSRRLKESRHQYPETYFMVG